jgi:hypothetical protein
MSGPRNRPGYEEGQELHGFVRDIVRLLRCPHCGDRPTAKAVLRHLPEKFQDRDLRTINTHIREVIAELEQEEQTIDESVGTVSLG